MFEIIKEYIKNVLNEATYTMFHGTDRPVKKPRTGIEGARYVLFSEFKTKSSGIFFASTPEEAKQYGNTIYVAKVIMNNPLLDPNRDGKLGVDKLDWEKERVLAYILEPFIKEDKYGDYVDIGVQRHYVDLGDQDNFSWIYNFIDSDGLIWDVMDNPECVRRMKRAGFDGTFVHETDGHYEPVIFIISPKQIIGWEIYKEEENYHNDEYD